MTSLYNAHQVLNINVEFLEDKCKRENPNNYDEDEWSFMLEQEFYQYLDKRSERKQQALQNTK